MNSETYHLKTGLNYITKSEKTINGLFKAALIRKPRIVFRPGVELKEILDKVSFERIDAETGSSSGGSDGEDDRPVIE